jgi:ketosteroid isomerase-like protein
MNRSPTNAEAAERAFYAAMADGDLDRMMSLWVDDDAAICNHPGGPRLVGPAAIRASFRDIFSNGGVTIVPASVRAWRSPDVAVHSLIERIAVQSREGAQVVEVVATNVFVRTPAGWRILVHHAGVSETDSADDDLSDDDDDEPDSRARGDDPRAGHRRGWSPGRSLLDPASEDDGSDDDASSGADPSRPPPGRLH